MMPMVVLLSFLVVFLIVYEMWHGANESLSINRLLYCEIVKGVPVLAAYVNLAVVFIWESKHWRENVWMWIWLLILVP